MSIVDRLKSLFKGNKDKEETDKSKVEVKSTNGKSKVTSSKNKLNDNNVVSGTKTSESISKNVPEKKDKKSSTKNMPSKEEVKASKEVVSNKNKISKTSKEKTDSKKEPLKKETPKKEVSKEEPKIEETVSTKEDSQEESTSNNVDEEISKDEVDVEESNKNDKKSDNMTLLTDKELLNDESLDKDFTAAFVDAGIETVQHCFQCGTCGGTCPSGRRTPYKVRQLVRKCLLGLKEEVISDDALWMCTTCYTCQERCPRSVVIVEIIKKARNIAAHAGYMAKAHKMTGLFVITTGHGVPINPATKELRKRVGLSELPPTTHMFPEALKEIQTICKLTGFDDLIGYDEETGELKPDN